MIFPTDDPRNVLFIQIRQVGFAHLFTRHDDQRRLGQILISEQRAVCIHNNGIALGRDFSQHTFFPKEFCVVTFKVTRQGHLQLGRHATAYGGGRI